MKNAIILFVLCLMIIPVRAQKVIEKHIDFSQKESVAMNIQIADSIVVHTWNKKEVFVKALVDVNDNKDNDSYQTDFEESGPIVKVTAKFEDNYMSHKHGSLESKIAWDIYIPENVNFSVKTIDGNIIISGNAANIDANSISGNVIITGKSSDVEANSISGFVDITVSPDTKADLEFKTISGTIYSNHEITPSEKTKGSNNISDQMNGGGFPIKLKTISGNIYFRKM